MVEGLLSYTVTQVASGREHTLFLTSSGAVFGAGSGQLGQLAHAGAGRTLLVPEKVWEGGAAVIAGGFSSAVVGEGAGGHVVLGKRPITLGEGIWEGMEGCIARIQSLKARADSQTPQVR